MNRLFASVAACCLLGATVATAQTKDSYPMLMSVHPVAVQVGQTSEVELASRYTLFGSTQVLVVGEGLIGEVVPPEKPPQAKPGERPNLTKMKLRFTAAADAIPGIRSFRLITPLGPSTLGQVVIVRDPVVIEAPPKKGEKSAANAQEIPIPSAVCGILEKKEDVDHYRFRAEAGTTLTFHIRAQRIENRIHDLQSHVDPIVTLRNAMGSTLATSDNVFAGDPLLSHKFETAGEYTLEIRDVRYEGNPYWVYCIEINNRPFVTQVYPLAVTPGETTAVSVVGANLPSAATADITLPAKAEPGLQRLSPPVGGHAVNDVQVLVNTLPAVMEAAGDNNTFDKGQVIPVPACVNGRIETPADGDCYIFEAKKGEAYSFNVVARQAGSALDPILHIENDKQKSLVENDDTRIERVTIPDSSIEFWRAPADGRYAVHIRDLHLRGSDSFVYALLVTRSQPEFELEVDTDKTGLAPGIAAPIFVDIIRRNGFTGEVQLHVEGLPAGITATCGKILPSLKSGCIILQATDDAPRSVANIRIRGTATHKLEDGTELQLSDTGRPLQEIYFPGGGRGHYPVALHTVAVAEPMDIRRITLSVKSLTLKPGESQKVEVAIERAPDYKGNVTLDMMFQHLRVFCTSLPKGVTIDGGKSKTLLTGTESKGHITLKAAADAEPVENQLVPVMAHVSINFVMKWTWCGEPFTVTVEKPAENTPAKP